MTQVATIMVALFGLVILGMSVWGIVSPRRLVRVVQRVMHAGTGMVAAVGARIILGAALIIAAPVSWTPRVFLALGVLILAAAFVLPFVGSARVEQLLAWAGTWPAYALRLWLVVGILFGAYLTAAVT